MLRNFVIVSAHKTCRSARENDIASLQLRYILKKHGYNPTPVLGSYNEVQEESWRCEVRNDVEVTDIASIAAGFQQETILVERGDMGFLKMVDRPGVKEHCLGSRRVLSQAPKASDWSLIDGSYIQFK